MKRLFSQIILILVFLLNLTPVFAQNYTQPHATVVPETKVVRVVDCQILMSEVEMNIDGVRSTVFADRETLPLSDFGLKNAKYDASDYIDANDVLGCGIKTGDIPLWMVPFYIRYVLEFILGIAGLISVAGIVVGGYMYLFAGFSDSKDRGKMALIYSVAGFVLTMLSFVIVNIVIAIVTG